MFFNSAIQDVETLLENQAKLCKAGFLENENFEECDSIILIEDEKEITFDGYPDISMKFLGYEAK